VDGVKEGRNIGKSANLEGMCSEILASLDRIAKVISCGETYGDALLIYDPPYVLEVGKGRIVLKEGDEEVAILTPEGVEYARSEEETKILEEWCVALTSLSFRRFFVKDRKYRQKWPGRGSEK